MCAICMNQHTAEQSFSENFDADEAREIINNELARTRAGNYNATLGW